MCMYVCMYVYVVLQAMRLMKEEALREKRDHEERRLVAGELNTAIKDFEDRLVSINRY